MSGYLYGLALCSVVIALCCALLPASVIKHARLLCSLCVICIVLAPVTQFVSEMARGEWELPDLFGEDVQEEQGQDEAYDSLAQSLLAGQLQVLLERDLNLTADQCRVYVVWGAEGEVQQVTLLLSGKAIWRDPAPIKAYVEQLLGCECIVILD